MDSKKDIYLTLTEVADYLNVSRGTISSRSSRGEMPEPDAYTFKGRSLWKIESIEYLKGEIISRNK